MKITIAVPSFNYARFLRPCLDSIRTQSYPDFEVLIADGGSSDGSVQIIEEYCRQDDRFKFVSRSDAGQADAIKRAFAHASGDILCFLNADDCFLHSDVFSTVVDDFKNHTQVSVLTYGGDYLDAEGKKIKRINYRYHPLDGFHWMRYRTAIIQPATFWLKHVYKPEEWPSNYHFVFDVVFFYQAYLKYQWLESSTPVAGYRLHGENKSMSVKSKRVLELAAFEELKFGNGSFRSRYLKVLARLIAKLETMGSLGKKLTHAIYLFNNSLSFLSFYRIPGI
jgi:glycosyltransferase involved in cell wall biosynthesis